MSGRKGMMHYRVEIKQEAVRLVLEENPRLEIILFPTASPDLNPQEHAWKSVRKKISHNHFEARLPELADRFLNQLKSTAFQSSFLDKYGYSAICPLFNDFSIRFQGVFGFY